MPKPKHRNSYSRRKGGQGPGMVAFGAVIAAILVLVIIRLIVPHAASTGNPQDGKPVAPTIVQQLSTVPTAAYAAAGLKGAPLAYGAGKAIWRVDGKPVFFYLGGEYCPYCGASRWSMITALARFGKWSGLEYMTSSSTDVYPNTPTFTFVHATYQSPYVDFQPVEGWNRSGPAATYTLETPDAQQAAAISKYSTAPYVPQGVANAIPFMDLGNRYIWEGSLYDPALLQGLTWPGIARSIHAGKGPVAQAVLSAANVLSAGICALDGGRPAVVCTSAPVAAAAARLPGVNLGKQPVGGGTA